MKSTKAKAKIGTPRKRVRGETRSPVTSSAKLSLPETINALVQEQRRRRFCITAQSRCDRSIDAFVVRLLGYTPDLDEKERKKLFARAAKLRRGIEAGESIEAPELDMASLMFVSQMIVKSAESRDVFDEMRDDAERKMAALAKTLPAYEWVKEVRGLGDLAFAIIVAECPGRNYLGLSEYPSAAHVWKRLGLAVIDGERQRKKADKELALKHAYSPRRRAEIYACVGDPLLKHQTMSNGPYREVYDRRRADTELRHPEWADKAKHPGHYHNDAKRFMEKRLVRDLWRAWRRATNGVVSSNGSMSPGALDNAA